MVKIFIKRIIALNIIFTLIMTMYRTIFMFYYFNFKDLTPYTDLIKAFILGFRYDCAILAYINSLITLSFIIFWFIDSKKLFIKFVKSLKYYYTITFSCISLFFCINFVYYHYFQEDINYLIFNVFKYKISYLLYISKNEHFLFLLLFIILLMFIIVTFLLSKYILEKKLEKEVLTNQSKKKKIVSLIIVSIEFIIVINVLLPTSYNNCFCEQIAYCNGIFNVYKITIEALKERDWIKEFKYQNNVRKMFADYLDVDISEIPEKKPELAMLKETKYNKDIENINLNIILVIMESVAMDLLQYNSTEFSILRELKKHFDEDITFYNCLYSYAGTTSSIEIIFQSILRVPKLANRKEHFFINSEMKNIIDEYKLNGYFTTCISIFPYPVNFDNEILNLKNDEYEFNKVFDILNKNDEKQFIFVVTKNNHHPFIFPYNYKPLEMKIPQDFDIRDNTILKRLQTYQYSCQKLGEFLTKLKKSKYADNTIVVMVGDHWSRIKYSNDLIINKSVPLYFYIPEKLKPAKDKIDTTRIVSHLDIMPTLYELSLSSVTYYSLGMNVFDNNYQNAISSNYENAIIVNENDMCTYDVDFDELVSYKINRHKDKLVKYERTALTKKHKKMLKQYKAAIAISQYLAEKTKKQME